MKLPVVIRGVEFANPVLAASGTFGFGIEFPKVARRLGGVVTKALTVLPREGNPPPRIAEVFGGVVNSVGLENPGLEAFKQKVIPRLKKLGTRVIVNIAGFTIDEFLQLTDALNLPEIDGIEINLSCPNVKAGGVNWGQKPKTVERVTSEIKKRTEKLLIVKLTGNFVDPAETGRAAEAGGADAVTVLNTLFALVLDETGSPLLGARTGGLSGPAIKPFALFCVDRVANAVKIPVIGCGGIMSGSDAFEFLCAGASLVQIGTAHMVNPRAGLVIIRELAILCRKRKIRTLTEIIGKIRGQK